MRALNHKEQGELDFWIDYVNGGCERETGHQFKTEASKGAKGRLEFYFKNIPEPVPTDGRVWVDVGSGPYPILLEAPEGVTRIMIDPLMKHYAYHQILQPSNDSAHNIYLESLGEEIVLLNESSDIVFCTNTLDHVYDPFTAMREMVRILKPGGILIIETDVGGITDELHPHAIRKEAINSFLEGLGMERIFNNIAEGGKRRPGAKLFYGFYRRTEKAREYFQVAGRPPRKSLRPILVEEGFQGFNIIKLQSQYESVYYGILQSDGPFLYSKIEEKAYKVFFEGKSADEVKNAIITYYNTKT